eukprot:129954-Amphidinium_carterae.1
MHVHVMCWIEKTLEFIEEGGIELAPALCSDGSIPPLTSAEQEEKEHHVPGGHGQKSRNSAKCVEAAGPTAQHRTVKEKSTHVMHVDLAEIYQETFDSQRYIVIGAVVLGRVVRVQTYRASEFLSD